MDDIINVSVCNKEQTFHWHEWMEITFVIRGSATGISNNESIELTAGEIWVVNRDVVHCIEDCSDDLIYVQLFLNMEKFNQYIPNIWTVYFKCGPENNSAASIDLKKEIRGRICAIVNMLSLRTHNLEKDNKIIYACIEILNDLKLKFNLIGKEASDIENNENFDRVWRITDYIYDNCNRKLTLKEVADMEHISEAYLSKILKKETGNNFEETVGYIRAECSIRYLLETNMSITDISYECGFSAPRYYNSTFLNKFKCTPIEYRKKIKTTLMYMNNVGADSIIYQEGVDKSTVYDLLQKYSQDTYLSWEAANIVINFDNFDLTNVYHNNLFYKDTVKCSVDAVLSYKFQKILLKCREELGIKKIVFDSSSSANNRKIAEENIKTLGMSIGESSGRAIELDELFDDNNVVKGKFFTQKILNHAKESYMVISEGVFVYQNGLNLNVIIKNDYNDKEKRFKVSFQGEKACQAFVVKRITASEREKTTLTAKEAKLNNCIDAKTIEELRKPQETIEIVDNLSIHMLEELVESKQVKLITVTPL